MTERDRLDEERRYRDYEAQARNYREHWHDREQREERDRQAYDAADDDEPVHRSVTHTRSRRSRSTGGPSADPTGAFIVGGAILAVTVYPWILTAATVALGLAAWYELGKLVSKK